MNPDKLWNRDFILLCISTFLLSSAFYILLPSLPVFLTSHLGADKSEVGVLLGAFTIAALLVRPFAGLALDRGSRSLVYLGSLAAFGLCLFPYGFVGVVEAMILLRVLHGITWGFASTSGGALVVDFIPPTRRGEGIGYFGFAQTAAMATGPLVATAFPAGTETALFCSAGGIGLGAMALAAFIRYPERRGAQPRPHGLLATLIERRAVPVALNMCLLSFCYGALLSFAPLYAKEMGIGNSGPFFMFFALGLALSRVFAGRAFDVRGPRLVGATGVMLLIVGFAILFLVKNPFVFHATALGLGAGMGMLMPTMQAMINNLIEPHRRGAANSTFFTAFDLGIGAGMVTTGLIADAAGLQTAFGVCAVLCMAGLAVFLGNTVRDYERRRAA